MHRIFPVHKRFIQVKLSNFHCAIVQPQYLQCTPRLQSKFSTTTNKEESLWGYLQRVFVRNEGYVNRNILSLTAVLSRNFSTSTLEANLHDDKSSGKKGKGEGKKRKGKKNDYNIDAMGTWDNRIDLPIMMEASIKQGEPIPRVTSADVGCSSILGKRTYQEDRFIVFDLPDNILCTAVFDGHGGSECSEFCYMNLETVLLDHLKHQRDLEAVLHHTFLKLNSLYAAWTKDNNAGLRAGSTATVCLLRGGVELTVGHVGDSRAILCRSGQVQELSYDHCPSVTGEKVRINQSGGRVNVDNIGRHLVNETLSMTRSIGDLHLKQYGVTALPDTRSIRVKHGKDAFLLLITDGITFVLRNEETCNIVNQAENPIRAAQLLTEQALSMSSDDNMTAVVVPFGSWGKYTKSASMFYSFGIGRDMNKSSRFG